ncbi:hypothetical protein CRG98_000543 [Punica granatum]|uniref:Uncharacterized protein n=1 Tax=Punica granatum TaxID=22663 RepID=A0A2I0LEF7_PUNGR|nr:hypothetical protein CRG98_000543 [Punica granatum]
MASIGGSLPIKKRRQRTCSRKKLCVNDGVEWGRVIFDHNDGAEDRTIFLPDQGNEMSAKLGNIRVTMTWNEATEIWHRRGPRLLLEVIEEYEQEWLSPYL